MESKMIKEHYDFIKSREDREKMVKYLIDCFNISGVKLSEDTRNELIEKSYVGIFRHDDNLKDSTKYPNGFLTCLLEYKPTGKNSNPDLDEVLVTLNKVFIEEYQY